MPARLAAILTFFGVIGMMLALERSAAATPSITINKMVMPTRSGIPVRSPALTPLGINFADCVADEVISFPVVITDPQNLLPPQVWATTSGANCADASVRQNNATGCWRLPDITGPTVAGGGTIDVHVRDLVIKRPIFGDVSRGSVDDCLSDSAAAQSVTLYFLLASGNGQPAVASDSTTLKYDLRGPAAPTGITTGPGETELTVDWTASTDMEVLNYAVYCFPGPVSPAGGLDTVAVPAPAAVDGGTTATAQDDGGAATAGGTIGTTGSTSSVCVDASVASTDDAASPTGDAAVDLDAALDDGGTTGGSAASSGSTGSTMACGTTGSVSSGSTGGTTGASAACPAGPLVTGTIPDATFDQYFCGSANGPLSTGTKVTGLENGNQYAIAVAAVDGYGNLGPLSTIGCGTPVPVDSFFDVWGGPSNGLCAVRAPGAGKKGPSDAWLGAGGALVGVLLLGARRRPRRAGAKSARQRSDRDELAPRP